MRAFKEETFKSYSLDLNIPKYVNGCKFHARCESALQLQVRGTTRYECVRVSRMTSRRKKNVVIALYTLALRATRVFISLSLLHSLFLSGVISAARGIKGLIRFLPLSLFVAPYSETRVHYDDVTQRLNEKKTKRRTE